MRTFNLRLILWLAGIFVVTAIVVHFVHDYQVHKNAYAFLEMAEKSEEVVREMATERKGTPDQIRDAIEQTVRHYRRYLALDPENLSVRIKYASFLMDIPDPVAAFLQNERILREDPEDEELLAQQEQVREKQIRLAMRMPGRLGDAIFHINKLLETRKNDATLLEMRGICELNRKDSATNNEDAARSFEEAIKVAPDRLSSYALLATVQRDQLNNPGIAVGTIESMVKANPDVAGAYVARARFLLSDKDPAKLQEKIQNELIGKANADCEKALELEPKNPNAMLLQVDCVRRGAQFIQDGTERGAQYARAKDLLKELITLKPDEPALYSQWVNLELLAAQSVGTADAYETGTQAAVAAVRQGLDAVRQKSGVVPPQSTFDLRWLLADLLIGDSQHDAEVDQLLQGLRAERPDGPEIAFLEARRLMGSQKWLEATKLLEENRTQLAAQSNLSTRADRMLGQCYAQLGDQDLRLQIAQQAANQSPMNVTARTEVAESLVALGRNSEALAQYQEIIQLPGRSLQHLIRYTDLMLSDMSRQDPGKQDWNRLHQLVDAIEKASPDDPRLPIMRAEVFAAEKKFAEAEQTLLEARKKDPNEFRFWSALVQQAQQQGDPEKAAQRLEELQHQFGDTIDVRLARASYLGNSEAADAGSRMAELVADIDKFPANEQVRLYWQLATVALGLGENQLGLQYGQQAAKLVPNNLRLRLFLLDVARVDVNAVQSKLEQAKTDKDEAGIQQNEALSRADVKTAQQLVAEIDQIEGGGVVTTYAQAVLDLIRFQAEGADTLKQAQSRLRSAAQQRKQWSEIPVLQGMIATAQGDRAAALDFYQQAIDLGDRKSSTVFEVARSLYMQRRYVEADEIVRRLQEQRSDLPVTVGRLASRINFQREDYNRALDLAEIPARKSAEVEDKLWYGWLQTVNRKYDEAEVSLRSVIEQDPQEAAAWMTLVRCLVLQGTDEKLAEAEQTMQEAITKVKPDVRASVHAECLRMLKRDKEAIEVIRAAVQENSDSPALLRSAADVLGSYSDTRDEAKAILERFVRGEVVDQQADEPTQQKTMQWARINLARVLSNGEYQEFRQAIELLNQNLAEDPESPQALELRSRLLATRGQLAERQEAKATLQRLDRSVEGLEAENLFLLANQHRDDGEWREYQDAMNKVLRVSENSPRREVYITQYINALIAHGDSNTALAVAQREMGRRRDDMMMQVMVAKALVAQQRPAADESLRIVKDAVDNETMKPVERSMKLRIAVISLKNITQLLEARLKELGGSAITTVNTSAQSDASRAGTDAKPSDESDPVIAANRQIAQLIQTQIVPIKAAIDEYYQEIIGDDPKQQLMWVSHLVSQGKLKEAVELTKKHWAEADLDLQVSACASLLNQEDLEASDQQAIEQLVKDALATRQGEESLRLLHLLAGYYVNQGRNDEAVARYREILAIAEKDLVALNNVSVILASQKKDVDDALKYIEKAVKVFGPQPMLLDSQAMVLLASGDSRKAIQAMQSVVQEKPERVTKQSAPDTARRWGGYYFHLALAQMASGNRQQAAEALQKSRELGFDRDDVFVPEQDAYDKLVKDLG